MKTWPSAATLAATCLLLAACSTIGAIPPPADTSPTPTPNTREEAKRAGRQAVRAVRAAHATIPRIAVVNGWLSPDGGPYGVGTVVSFWFDQPIPKTARANVEDHLTVDANRPLPEGVWVWRDAQTMTYRTARFLPGHTRVRVAADLHGVVLLRRGREILVGGRTATARFYTGADLRIHVNGKTHQATVTKAGRVVRRMPVSLGKPGFETRSGIKTTMERARVTRMTNQGVTTEFYDLQVPWTVRITDTGEYLHGAPWAVDRLGRWNGSHGCTNLSVADARWVYRHSVPGIPVVTTGTHRTMEPWNGPGAVWNYTWRQWKAMATE